MNIIYLIALMFALSFFSKWIYPRIPNPLPRKWRLCSLGIGLIILAGLIGNTVIHVRDTVLESKLKQSSTTIQIPSYTPSEEEIKNSKPTDWIVLATLVISSDIDDDSKTTILQKKVRHDKGLPKTSIKRSGNAYSLEIEPGKNISSRNISVHARASLERSNGGNSSGGGSYSITPGSIGEIQRLREIGQGPRWFQLIPSAVDGQKLQAFNIIWIAKKDDPLQAISLSDLPDYVKDLPNSLAYRPENLGWELGLPYSSNKPHINRISSWLGLSFMPALAALIFITVASPWDKSFSLMALVVIFIFALSAVDYWALNFSRNIALDSKQAHEQRMRAAHQMQQTFFWQGSAQEALRKCKN